ncbi:MAG: aldehyde dehydrogenase family protein [Pseudomonadota bacterium]
MASIPEILDSMDYGPAPEDASFAYEWLKAHDKGFGHFIGGTFTKAGKALFPTKNPATGKTLAKLTQATKADVNKAVKAASEAFGPWSKLSGHERARHLYALARIVQKECRFLAVLDTLDNGKPIRETRDIDIPLVARHFYHHAGWAQILESTLPGAQPHGVCGQIIPWNFPLLMLAWKVAPALAAGNTVVLKPAEYTSLSALYFAELAKEVGLPDGVLNIVTGDGAVGEMIVGHKDIQKIAFTGSTSVGKAIAAETAGTGKALTLELGGKSPYIVFDDADLDSAVEGLVDAIFFNQGEVCCAGSRLLVQESVEEALVAKLKARLSTFRIGDPLDKAIDMGALADPVQVSHVEQHMTDAVHEGATLWQPAIDCPKGGCFIKPSLLLDVEQANVAVREEIFGPVLTVQSFRTLPEAAALANNTRYGLAASIWSENIGRAMDMAGRVEAGVVWINTANQFDAAVGFGGMKESGYGREGGLEGLRAYVKQDWPWTEEMPLVHPLPKTLDKPYHDKTTKNYIGGKQVRNDNGRTKRILSRAHWSNGTPLDRVGIGNRKDIRNAVEAAVKAKNTWAAMTGHQRAQILYFLAENYEKRQHQIGVTLSEFVGTRKADLEEARDLKTANTESRACVERLFSAAAWADKFDGAVHSPPKSNITLAQHEPQGVVGIVCPNEAPLLNFVTMVAFAIAAGNTVVAIPSFDYPIAATELIHILEASDSPPGVINIVTGESAEMTKTLAEHDGVDGLWVHADAKTCKMAEIAGAQNMKRMWCSHGQALDWTHPIFDGDALLRLGSEVKNIWLPYGE